MNCVMGALDKIHQLIQIKAVGFTIFWSMFLSQNKSCACWATPGLWSQCEPNPDFGRSLSLDFSNKVR